jgi:deoxyadenosine/deoxycytidine kinase
MKAIFICLEGILCTGKSTLLERLEASSSSLLHDVMEIWFEPVALMNDYSNGQFKPLDLFYKNPKQEAFSTQLHIINSLGKYYADKLKNMKDSTKIVVTDRCFLSSFSFINSMYRMSYISDFQRVYLIDIATEIQNNLIKQGLHIPNKYIFINTNIDICMDRIIQRNANGELCHLQMKLYLEYLQEDFSILKEAFAAVKGSNSVISLKHTAMQCDQLEELVSFLEQILSPTT